MSRTRKLVDATDDGRQQQKAKRANTVKSVLRLVRALWIFVRYRERWVDAWWQAEPWTAEELAAAEQEACDLAELFVKPDGSRPGSADRPKDK